MKNANGYGSISKLSGNRRKPYMVRVTQGWNLEGNKAIPNRKVLGYYATQKEAQIALAEYNKNPYNLNKNTATVSDIWQLAEPKIKVSDERKKVYESAWNKYLVPLHDRPIANVKSQELIDVVDNCPYGYSTKVNLRTILKHIFDYAYDNDYIDKNYSTSIKIEREEVQLERQIYTLEEIENLWKHLDDNYYRFTLILLYQGMRLTELRDLPLENIDLESNTISITKAKNKQSVRTIPIHSKVRKMIEENIHKSVNGKLFNFNKSQYERFAGNILNHKAYDTRHTFATRCAELGIEKVFVQKIMGHKPDSVLEQFYTHLSIERISEELERLDYR